MSFGFANFATVLAVILIKCYLAMGELPHGWTIQSGIGTAEVNLQYEDVSKTTSYKCYLAELLDPTKKQEVEAALSEHNRLRKVHGSPPLVLDEQLTQEAQQYAKKLSDYGKLKYSTEGERYGAGENIAMSCAMNPNDLSFLPSIRSWYNEVCGYNFDMLDDQQHAGQFTQMVWKSSSNFGFGTVVSKKYDMTCIFIVARYNPPGNIGRYGSKFNVFKGSFDRNTYCESN